MKKHLNSLNLTILVEIIAVILTAIGVFPREAVLFLTGFLIFYIIFSPVIDSLALFIVSIPIFAALPISDRFDSMANWRILLSILFLAWFVKSFFNQDFKKGIKASFSAIKSAFKSKLGFLASIFLLFGFISLLFAFDAAAGFKKLLFLINIFLLFIIIKNVAKNKETILKLMKAVLAAVLISLIAGYAQLISVFFVSLYAFWQWWAKIVIPVFYGENLGNLLSWSNTWFSYYPNAPATLRMFGIFPDSHSFAMFSVLSLPFLIALFIDYKIKKTEKSYIPKCPITYHLLLITIILVVLSILLTGSRGVWVGVIPAVLIAVYFLIKKFDFKKIILSVFISFLLFFALFPVSSVILPFTREKAGDGKFDSSLMFKRASSITDFEEISNMGRLEIWGKSLNALRGNIFFGIGAGNMPVALDKDISAAKRGASAHNLYLDIATEMGIFALIVVLAIFFDIFKTSWRVFRQSKDILFKAFAGVFSIYFIWVLSYSFFDVVLLNDKVLLLFMAAVGLVYSIMEVNKNEKRKV